MQATAKTEVNLLEPDKGSQLFIIIIALVQALLLYVAQVGTEQKWGWFGHLHGMVYWYTLVLVVPTSMLLSVQHWRQRRFWLNTLLVSVLFAHMASWALYNATGAPGIEANAILGPFGFSQAVLLFVLLPFLQSHLLNRAWQLNYQQLFNLAWQNALTLLLMSVFVGLCWLVLHLGASLFALIELTLPRDLLRKKPVIYLLTGLMVGLGILIGRTQHNAISVLRNMLFVMFKGLLPLLAFIAVAFVVSLPFTGLEPLWSTRHAAAILICLQLSLLLFVNAVAQTGTAVAPYPRLLRYLINTALCCLPVFALLALFAIYLRLNQYGMTQERLYALLIVIVLAAHALGYCLAAWRSAGGWLQLVGKVNIGGAGIAIMLLIAVNSPLLDAQRLTVNSQLPRLQASIQDYSAQNDLYHLRFSSGRRGYQALQQLQATLDQADPLADEITTVLARPSRYRAYQTEQQLAEQVVTELELLQQNIRLADWVSLADENWWQALLTKQLGMLRCLQADASCVLLQQDLDQDGQDELILCDLGEQYRGGHCQIYQWQAQWQADGTFYLPSGNAGPHGVRSQLLAEPLQIKQRRYPDVRFNERTIAVNPQSD